MTLRENVNLRMDAWCDQTMTEYYRKEYNFLSSLNSTFTGVPSSFFFFCTFLEF